MLKQIILILVAAGFIYGSYSSLNKAISFKNMKLAEAFYDKEESSENESGYMKFFGQNDESIFHLKIEDELVSQNYLSVFCYFGEVLKFPPSD